MKVVFIVDANSENLTTDLNAIAKREKLAFRFTPFPSPEQLFRALDESVPDLILLHHHWPGVRVAQLLHRIGEANDAIRVIVFTGQSLDISELIECVRFGAADYWTERGKLDHAIVFRKIEQYCHSSAWTIQNLKVPSGSLLQLLSEAEGSIKERGRLDGSIAKLRSQLGELRSQEHRDMKRTIGSGLKFLFNSVVLTCAFIACDRYTTVGLGGALALVGIIASFFLFLEGKLAEAIFKWKGGSAKLKAK